LFIYLKNAKRKKAYNSISAYYDNNVSYIIKTYKIIIRFEVKNEVNMSSMTLITKQKISLKNVILTIKYLKDQFTFFQKNSLSSYDISIKCYFYVEIQVGLSTYKIELFFQCLNFN